MLKTNLKDRVAVITGGTRGIGLGIAEVLAANGAKIAVVGTNADKMKTALETIRQENAEAEGFLCNVAVTEEAEKTVESVLAKFGKIDILVNCAGITRDVPLGAMKDEEWDDVIGVNLRGPFLFTRACSKPMRRAKRGRIVNITSISGLIGNKGQANYSASKAGLIGFTRTVSKELAGKNITVNAVAPGFIETDMTAVLPEVYKVEIKNRIPLGRIGLPEDIANAVLFFVSDEASFVTGQILTVDGGMIR
ncbi:MAG: 3-oxoacyl-[acyl-carrier-protein] reductase [Planctomycetaceae bacterium]|jgi:3-oxoacyl-[acyl-carrier protein] reductase|nr:3-oxoacyl-[acyl-carrier-protein] reductase [Planctomycetaceae bacterium]